VGRKGTVVSLPHAEQLVVVSTRSRPIGDPPAPAAGLEARFALQLLHRLGSFLKFLSAKKSCSPAVQMNSVPQSHQLDLPPPVGAPAVASDVERAGSAGGAGAPFVTGHLCRR
jgi:hypothetical protein